MMATTRTMWGTILCSPNRQPRVLLAQDVQRRKEIYEEMPTMPKIRSILKQVKHGPPYIMASPTLHAIGTECGEPTFLSTVSVLIPTGRNRLLHQMDRSCSSLKSLDNR